jgi:hypothetical protein
MRTRLALVAVLAVSALAGCSTGEDTEARGGEPPAVAFTKVALPAGATPVLLSTSDDTLLVGVRRKGAPVVPGLLRGAADGAFTEIPVTPASPYGKLATWYSVVSDGDRIVAIGGERGGAHANVRWSVWNGSAAGLNEQPQGFSTFGGQGAGELADAVLTPGGPVLAGSWESAHGGLDVAVWTNSGAEWNRQSSAGTALESTPDRLGLPIAATALEQGVLVVGWQLTGGAQIPAVWRSATAATGWTTAALPDAGRAGTAMAVRCWESTCAVAGRVDDRMALWQLSGTWTRLPDVPPVPVGDQDHLVAPVRLDGQLAQVFAEGDEVKIARTDGRTWTVRTASGPTGRVTAATVVGDTLYVVAGPDDDNRTVWRADVSAVR